MSIASAGLAILSMALLGICTLGETNWGFQRFAWRRRFGNGAGSVCERSLDRFTATLPNPDEAGKEAFFVALSERLTERFDHNFARFTIWSNYLFWALSPVVPRLRFVENTEHLFRYSSCGLCSQLAQAFVDVATRRGQQARVVALQDHVIAEAWYKGRWHAFDPDYGVMPRTGEGILSSDELARSPELARSVYRKARLPSGDQRVVAMLESGGFRYLSAGAHHSPKTARMQRVLHGLKWIVPLAGFVAAGLMNVDGVGT